MYKQRMKVFLVVLTGVMLVLASKLVHLQIIHGQDHRNAAEEAMRSVQVLSVVRGKITDREGRILALDEPCFDFRLHYRFLTANEPAGQRWVRRQVRLIARKERISMEAAGRRYKERSDYTWAGAHREAERIGVDLDGEVRRIVERVREIRRIVNLRHVTEVTVRDEQQYHAVLTGLDETAALRLKTRLERMIGAEVRSSYRRWYPYGHDACHVIGMTGKVWPEEMERLNLAASEADWLTRVRHNYLPGDRIGKVGVEKMCERTLRGRRGYRRFRLTGEELRVDPGIQGRDVHLTLDVVLQRKAAALLEAKGFTGSAVVLGLGTPQAPRCEVLAMASVPTYDLNTYPAEYPDLLADAVRLPLMHRAIVQRYQPGSTVKPLAAMAGLGSGAIGLSTTINCRGYLYDPTAFRCWIWPKAHTGHGSLNVVEALQHSCNVFFYEVGNRVHARRLCEWFAMFGFADKPGMGLPSERPGTVPTEQWLRAKGRAWLEKRGRWPQLYTRADPRFWCIGQGLLTATPVHLAAAMGAIAQDGIYLSPQIVLEGGPQQARRDLPVPPAHVAAVREGMHRVVNHRRGTAWKYFHGPDVEPLDGVDICGKTGTATTAAQRVDSNKNGRIDGGDRVVRRGDTAWFVGFAPYERPEVAFAVAVEYVKEGGGGANAAPIARELVRACQELGYVRR